MFVDACAIIALLADEAEAERVSDAIAGAAKRMTSPVAVLEAALGLARPDKFDLPVREVEPLILEFLEERGIEICDLPPAADFTPSHCLRRIDIAGRHGLNIGDCLHYACAKFYGVPILATHDGKPISRQFPERQARKNSDNRARDWLANRPHAPDAVNNRPIHRTLCGE